MATYVLVHGGGHGGWCYQRVARLLRAKGHEVYAPTLTGLGERAHLLNPSIDLETHLADVVSVLEFEDLHNVILVGHSYGGLVVLGVTDRAAPRIGKLVYLDAGIPQGGKSLAEYAGPIITTLTPHVIDGTEVVMVPEDYEVLPQIKDYFGVTDPYDRAWLQERLRPQPWKTFTQPLLMHNEAMVQAVPVYHVACSANVAHWSPEMIAQARADRRIWEIDTGHDLMITEPVFVAQALEEIAEAAG